VYFDSVQAEEAVSDFGWWAEHVKEEAMKVQRKHGAVETYEVLEESTNYYIIKGSATFVHVVSKADYEPVQEWVDVTHECYASLINTTYRIYHRKNGGTWIGDQYGYRVTNAGDLSKIKVEVKR